MLDRYQSTTLRLLPAGATVAGWDILPPTGSIGPFTAHDGETLRLNGKEFVADESEVAFVFIDVANRELSEEGVIHWFKQRTRDK
ncbi:MAG: hypothetical protein WB586_26340 [Chthoniobacterales bacterium]